MDNFLYDDVMPIRTRFSSVWHVVFADGTEDIMCLAEEFTINGVVDLIKAHDQRRFSVYPVIAGHYRISEVCGEACDARGINQDKIITLK